MRPLLASAALIVAPLLVGASPKSAQPPAPRKELVRGVDLSALFTGALGAISKGEVGYADLTADGVEEAIVPISSGGSAGDVAIAVYGYDEVGLLRPLLLHQGQHLSFKVEKGELVITEPVYGPNDPNCCPSGTTVMTYGWDRRALVLKSKRAGPAPKNAK